MIEPMSSPPNSSASWPTRRPWVTQRLEVRRSCPGTARRPPASSGSRPPVGVVVDRARERLPPPLEPPAHERAEAGDLVLDLAEAAQVLHPLLHRLDVPYIIVAVVDMPGRWAARITSSHSSEFVLRGAITCRTRSTRISAAAARQRVVPGVAQPPASSRPWSAASAARCGGSPAATARAGGPGSAT